MTPGYTTRLAPPCPLVPRVTSCHGYPLQAGTQHLIREYTSKEAKIAELKVSESFACE